MKHRLCKIFALCCLLNAMLPSAAALEYTIDGPKQSLFGQPTSDDTIYVTTDEPANTDKSKNAALIPPTFGSPTAYTLNSGEPLTPNLIAGNTMSAQIRTNSDISLSGVSDLSATAGNLLGTLEIPAISLSVPVYQGTDDSALAQGVGHFETTSLWNGNVAMAGHNRGVNSYFGKIHTLSTGDVIHWTTPLGTREYAVESVSRIRADDMSVLKTDSKNVLTLITCVNNQPDYRWCVRATA